MILGEEKVYTDNDPVINMTVKELKQIVARLPDNIPVIIPVIAENDANYILGFKHVRTAGLLETRYEDGPALRINSSENGLDMESQIQRYNGGVTCTRVMF